MISSLALVRSIGGSGSPVVGSIITGSPFYLLSVSTSTYDYCSPCAISSPYSKSIASSFSVCNESSSGATIASLPSSYAFLCLSTISNLLDIDFGFCLRCLYFPDNFSLASSSTGSGITSSF
nr:MAG TPA: hypothetical protein [Caudoviricetes sp.]